MRPVYEKSSVVQIFIKIDKAAIEILCTDKHFQEYIYYIIYR